MSHARRVILLLLASGFACGGARGSDFFLTVGGGYDPQGNQVSLERNVDFFRQVLAERRPDRPPHDIFFFADGADSHRDLQYRDPDFECSAGRRIAIELFGDADDLEIAYRNHTLEGVRQATSPRAIRDRLRDLGRQMGGDDRLMVYVTAHGGSGEDESPRNTSIYTWNHRRFRASEFENWLDQTPQAAPVVMVMVQCYAGGFANVIFNDADPDKGLSRQLRAGFFAQVHDRPAAGCTPEVNQETYQEYSSFFFAALAGHDRNGIAIEGADYDGDGKVSFAEAHAYAVCESETIDIPVRTSDAFLDYYSTDGTTNESPYAKSRSSSEPRRLPAAELVRAEGSLPVLLSRADDVDRAIARRLLSKLGLDQRGTAQQVNEARDRIGRQLRRARRSAGRAASSHRRARERVKSEVLREWPELDADLSPMLAALMAERSEEFARKVTSMPNYQTMIRLAKASDTSSQESLDAKEDEALVLRLERTLDRIAKQANLPQMAPPEVVERYQALVALESQGL